MEELLGRLAEDVIDFKMEDIRRDVRDALKAGISPRTIILDGMTRGMDVVGQKYTDSEYFLPELVMAGETMSEGVAELKPFLAQDTQPSGTVVMGTVKGDIHDVGKNIVSNLFTAAGFYVIDLGVDVSEDVFVKCVRESNANVLGMSALLSSSLREMENVIHRIRWEGINVKIIVGGASVSESSAHDMGADAYGRDAFVAIDILSRWKREEELNKSVSREIEKTSEDAESETKDFSVLLTMVCDKDPKVRQKAVYALEKTGEKGTALLIETLKDDDRIVARNASIALGRVKPIRLLREEFLKHPNEFLAIALGRTGDRTVAALLMNALESRDEGVRRGAAEGLGHLKERKAVSSLIKALEDESSEVRCRAIFSLSLIGDARAIHYLEKLLHDKSRKVRWRAAWTLGDFGEAGYREVFKALLESLHDSDWNVRRMAILTLRHDDPATISHVIEALGDENKYVRRYAAFVLGNFAIREAVPHLQKLLSDESREVVEMAGWALEKIEKKVGGIMGFFSKHL
jgi:5-methyltetrahydrofolate--homocysteine methyltransferase